MGLLLWLAEQTVAATVGFYVGRFWAERHTPTAKAIAAQAKAKAATERARRLAEIAEKVGASDLDDWE